MLKMRPATSCLKGVPKGVLFIFWFSGFLAPWLSRLPLTHAFCRNLDVCMHMVYGMDRFGATWLALDARKRRQRQILFHIDMLSQSELLYLL